MGTLCPRGHSQREIETREDGTRVCNACRREYQGRKSAARRVDHRNRAGRGPRYGSNYERSVYRH